MRCKKATLKRRGFTLIELLVAIAIIAILAAVALPRFVGARYRAYLSTCMLNERNIATALESYRADSNSYPGNLTVAVNATISAIPTCPSAPGSNYQYEVSSLGDNFTLSCPGFHEHQITTVPDGFPQYTATSGLREH